jgi:hypothetical protein
MSGLTGYLTSDGTDLSFIFMQKRTTPTIPGFSHVVQRFPIIGDTQFQTTLSYQTSSTNDFVQSLIGSLVYSPLSTRYTQPVAPGATRYYRLFAVYSDDMQNTSQSSFQIRFNFESGTPSSQTFSFPTTYGGTTERRIANSNRLLAVNEAHATVTFIIPGGVTAKSANGSNMSQVNVKITYIEIQYIDQY